MLPRMRPGDRSCTSPERRGRERRGLEDNTAGNCLPRGPNAENEHVRMRRLDARRTAASVTRVASHILLGTANVSHARCMLNPETMAVMFSAVNDALRVANHAWRGLIDEDSQ